MALSEAVCLPIDSATPKARGTGSSVLQEITRHTELGTSCFGQESSKVEICGRIEYRIVSSPAFCELEAAVKDVNHHVPQDRKDLLINKQTKFKNLLQNAHEDLAKRYSTEVPSSKKTRIWQKTKAGLEKFCRVVYHYSSVMDVLVSSHPEIAALAWGAMKFLLAISVNHQELKENIVEHLADIGEQFKIIDGYVRLFPEADMVEQVGAVYDNFIKFLQVSIDWCRENVFVKFFKNVALPYQARIKPIIDELNKYVRRIKDRVDVNNTYRLAVMQNDISALITSLDNTKRLQVNSHAIIAQLLRGIAQDQAKETDILAMQGSGDSKFESKKRLIYPAPTALAASVQTFPDHQLPFEHLKECAVQSLQLEADYSYHAIDLQNKPEVKTWLESPESSLLWIDGFAHSRASKWTTEFSVDVMLKAEEQGSIVLFYFGDIATDKFKEPSPEYFALTKAVINSFIAQLLRQHPSLVQAQNDWLTPQRWARTRDSTGGAWDVLQHLLQSLPNEPGIIYIILDSIDAMSAVSNSPNNLVALLQRMSALTTSSPAQESNLSSPLLAFKILITSVSGTEHTVLFPPCASNRHLSHSIVRVPQTFGQHNVPRIPIHQRKHCLKRLVRLPDSDEEFGFKPADSFEFSDEEGSETLAFSSDDEAHNSAPTNDSKRGMQSGVSLTAGQEPSNTQDRLNVRSTTMSSEELEFSDEETAGATRHEPSADDMQFSSSDDEA